MYAYSTCEAVPKTGEGHALGQAFSLTIAASLSIAEGRMQMEAQPQPKPETGSPSVDLKMEQGPIEAIIDDDVPTERIEAAFSMTEWIKANLLPFVLMNICFLGCTAFGIHMRCAMISVLLVTCQLCTSRG